MHTRAKDIMTTEMILATPEMTLEEAIKVLFNNRITGMPVIGPRRKLIGILSEFDVIRAIKNKKTGAMIPLSRLISYSKNPLVVKESALLADVLDLFVDNQVRRLPVVDKKGTLVGIITRRDIMRVLFYRSKKL